MDRSNTAKLTSKIGNLITDTAKKFPSTKIVYSTLLPRRDVPFEEITKINSIIGKLCACLANVHLIDHLNLNLSQQNILHDKKHLNQNRVKLFARNLKDAIYGRRPRTPFFNASTTQAPVNREIHLTPTKRETSQQNSTTYTAVVQRPPPLITTPTTHAPNTTETETRPPTTMQKRTDQEGTMNTSIPTKMLPLIQFFNNLI